MEIIYINSHEGSFPVPCSNSSNLHTNGTYVNALPLLTTFPIQHMFMLHKQWGFFDGLNNIIVSDEHSNAQCHYVHFTNSEQWFTWRISIHNSCPKRRALSSSCRMIRLILLVFCGAHLWQSPKWKTYFVGINHWSVICLAYSNSGIESPFYYFWRLASELPYFCLWS